MSFSNAHYFIVASAFLKCTFLNEIHLLFDSHLREIVRFGDCRSLYEIKIRSFVKRILIPVLDQSWSLNEIVFSFRNHLRKIGVFYKSASLGRIERLHQFRRSGMVGSIDVHHFASPAFEQDVE
jgi:hypothetical protein